MNIWKIHFMIKTQGTPSTADLPLKNEFLNITNAHSFTRSLVIQTKPSVITKY